MLAGSHEIATVDEAGMSGFVAYDPGSGRGAISAKQLSIFAGGKLIAHTNEGEQHLGAVAFEDRDHVLVAGPQDNTGVWRWTIGTDRWEQAAAVPQANAVAVAAGGIFVGTQDNTVVLVRGGAEVSRLAVAAQPRFLAVVGRPPVGRGAARERRRP